jgi:hypothetical protein
MAWKRDLRSKIKRGIDKKKESAKKPVKKMMKITVKSQKILTIKKPKTADIAIFLE